MYRYCRRSNKENLGRAEPRANNPVTLQLWTLVTRATGRGEGEREKEKGNPLGGS